MKTDLICFSKIIIEPTGDFGTITTAIQHLILIMLTFQSRILIYAGWNKKKYLRRMIDLVKKTILIIKNIYMDKIDISSDFISLRWAMHKQENSQSLPLYKTCRPDMVFLKSFWIYPQTTNNLQNHPGCNKFKTYLLIYYQSLPGNFHLLRRWQKIQILAPEGPDWSQH